MVLMAIIRGTSAYEKLYGTPGDDTFDGNGGNDLMFDLYKSNDTYIFDYGDYQPTITDSGGFDTIKFGPGIKASDIKFYITKGGYLMPRIKDTNDKPEVANWPDPNYKIERWVFEDGTVLTSDQIDKMIDYNTRVLVYSTGADNITVGGSNNLIYLMQGSDTITTVGGNNIIEASSGDDRIYNQGSGNDEIYMGPGRDYTEDWGGNDRYIFNRGDGQDTILDMAGNDVLKIGRTIKREEVNFSRSGNHLVVKIAGTSDSLTIQNWFEASKYKIETIEFWDGSTIKASAIDQALGQGSNPSTGGGSGTPSSNITPTIVGTNAGEYSGGNYGNDVYHLKQGNDKVMDYAGNDVYLFAKGDGYDTYKDQAGNDTLIFRNGITQSNVSFDKHGNDLVININNGSDRVTIIDWFRSSNYKIETIEFSDGSKLTSAAVDNIVLKGGSGGNTGNPGGSITPALGSPIDITAIKPTIVGTSAGEYSGGNYGNDIYHLRAGNDKVMDYAGNDIYLFGKGDGYDVIKDQNGTDSIIFGRGIDKDDIRFSRSGNDLLISNIETGDRISVTDWFRSNAYHIETIKFVDGSYYTDSMIDSLVS